MALRRADWEAAWAANEGEGEGDEIKEEDLGERPKFDEEAFNQAFDEDHPPVIIPPEVIDDLDNDFEEFPEVETNE